MRSTPLSRNDSRSTLRVRSALSVVLGFAAPLSPAATPPDYNLAGVELCTTITPAPAGVVNLEISSDQNFLPTVSTHAGQSGVAGSANGPRLSALFNNPSGTAHDAAGNLFVADTVNHVIRMIGPDGNVSTVAGSAGNFGFLNGQGQGALFSFPTSVAVGPSGNLYVADAFNHAIRKVTKPVASGLPWTVTTLAGTGVAGHFDGAGSVARFSHPHGLTVDAAGNVYVADALNHRIRRVTAAGQVSTFAGAGSPFLMNCQTNGTTTVTCNSTAVLVAGMSISGTNIATGTTVASITNGTTFELSANATGSSSGLVLTVFFEGSRGQSTFNQPHDVALDSAGNLYVADRDNHSIRKIGASLDMVTTIAGGTAGKADGVGAAARFNQPVAVVVDDDDNLHVCDKLNHSIRKVTVASATVTTVAGTGTSGSSNGKADVAAFNCPSGLTIDPAGNLVVADAENHLLRRVIIRNLTVAATVSGSDISVSLDAAALGLNAYTTYYIRWIDLDAGTTQMQGDSFFLVNPPTVTTTAASSVTPDSATVNGLVNPNQSATAVLFNYSTDPDLRGSLTVTTSADSLANPAGLAVDQGGNAYLALRDAHKIVKITPGGVVSDFAGTGTAGHADHADASQAQFDQPADVAIDSAGNLYVADERNHRIRRIAAAAPHAVTTVAGSGVAGFANAADALAGKLLFPCGVAVNGAGTRIYVADRGNHRVRLISGSGPRSLSTLAGTGTAGFADGPGATAQFNSPTGVAVDAATNVYVADRDNHRVRVVSPGSQVSTVAGSGTAGFLDANGTNARFSSPTGVALHASGTLYVADRGNHRLRSIDGGGTVATVAGSGIAGLFDSPAGHLVPATAAEFDQPAAVAVTPGGAPGDPVTLYVSDPGNGALRKVFRDSLLSVTSPQSPLPMGTLGDPDTAVSAPLPLQLWPGTTYFFRLRAENERGESVAGIETFTTPTRQMIALFDGPDTGGGTVSHAQSSALDFGRTPLGVPVTRELTISNLGEWPLEVSAITAPAGYAVTPDLPPGGTTINMGASWSIQVTLTGSPVGLYADNLTVTSDDPDLGTFTVPLSGEVLAPPSVTTLAATELTKTGVTLNAEVNPNGTSTTVWFHYSQEPDLDGFDVTTVAGSTPGYAPGPAASALFDTPRGLAADAAGNIYVADTENHRIRQIAPDGSTSTVAGDGQPGFVNGPAAAARFDHPAGVAVAPDGTIYVADTMNHRIRAISTAGNVTTHSGLGEAAFTDGVGAAARFNQPWGITLGAGGTLYVADRMNNRIRTVAPDGTAGTLTAGVNAPIGVAVNADGVVYVTEAGSHLVRRVHPDGSVDTLAGSAMGHADAIGAAAMFNAPQGLAVDSDGNILVADAGNHRIRRITAAGTVSTIAGTGIAGVMDGLGDDAQFNAPISIAVESSGDAVVGEEGSGTIRRVSSSTIVVEAAANLGGTDPILVSLPVTSLVPHSLYYLRVIASNDGGTTVEPNNVPFMGRDPTPFEQWQADNFGPDAANPAIAGPLADPNNDGIVNILKYAHFIDPFDDSSVGLPVVSERAGRLALIYTRNLSATDLAFGVECSLDFINWGPAKDLTIQTFDNNGTTEQVLASVPLAPDSSEPPGSPQPSKGIRLRVTLVLQP